MNDATELAMPPLPAAAGRDEGRAASRLPRRLTGTILAVTLILAASVAAGLRPTISGLPLAAALAMLGACVCAWLMVWARARAAAPPEVVPARWRLMRRLCASVRPGDAALTGRMARLPQALIGFAFAAAALAAVWLIPPVVVPLMPRVGFLEVGGGVLLAFIVLIAERTLADPAVAWSLPEAQALRAQAIVLLLCLVASGALAAGTMVGYGDLAAKCVRVLGVLPAAVAVELALRAAARLFVLASASGEAGALGTSTIALMLSEGLASRGFAAPIRQHLGIDFAGGFALRFVRAALPSVTLVVLLAVWLFTGIIPVRQDQRAIYERFGAPVRVLPPGLHVVLPWPFGQIRQVEFGPLHSLPLGDGAAIGPRIGAEDIPPPTADRLWEQAHPAEVTFLIASQSEGRQNFQLVSADIRAVWRIGLADADALRATYAVMNPEAQLHAAAGRVIAAYFAGETLPSVLGAARETQSSRLRVAIQAELDHDRGGIELTDLVIEAVHPPAGAADAYHAVQAVEIAAKTQVSAEQGRAAATLAKTAQYATEIGTQAHARAADETADAKVAASAFIADIGASHAGGPSFLLNRYLSNLGTALSDASLTILDHRIPAPDTPMLDLRPPTYSSAPGTGAE